MKITSLLFAVALTAHATTASPLPPVSVLPHTGPLHPIGTVSTFDASTLGDLVATLADETHRQGVMIWWANATNSSS